MCLLAGSRNCKPSIALLNNPQTERQLVARPVLPSEINFWHEAGWDQQTQILNSALLKRTCQPMKKWGLPLAMGGPFLHEPEPQNGVDFQGSCGEDGRTASVRKKQYIRKRISELWESRCSFNRAASNPNTNFSPHAGSDEPNLVRDN